MKEYRVPNPGPALIHSAVPAPDGSIWVAQAGSKKLGRFDPATGQWAEYEHDWRKHTIAAHPDGTIWSTGGLTRFDPATKTYTKIHGGADRLRHRRRQARAPSGSAR